MGHLSWCEARSPNVNIDRIRTGTQEHLIVHSAVKLCYLIDESLIISSKVRNHVEKVLISSLTSKKIKPWKFKWCVTQTSIQYLCGFRRQVFLKDMIIKIYKPFPLQSMWPTTYQQTTTKIANRLKDGAKLLIHIWSKFKFWFYNYLPRMNIS